MIQAEITLHVCDIYSWEWSTSNGRRNVGLSYCNKSWHMISFNTNHWSFNFKWFPSHCFKKRFLSCTCNHEEANSQRMFCTFLSDTVKYFPGKETPRTHLDGTAQLQGAPREAGSVPMLGSCGKCLCTGIRADYSLLKNSSCCERRNCLCFKRHSNVWKFCFHSGLK